jgi:hypothetical protein
MIDDLRHDLVADPAVLDQQALTVMAARLELSLANEGLFISDELFEVRHPDAMESYFLANRMYAPWTQGEDERLPWGRGWSPRPPLHRSEVIVKRLMT